MSTSNILKANQKAVTRMNKERNKNQNFIQVDKDLLSDMCQKVKATSVITYLALYSHLNMKTGLCSPSIKTLAEFTGLSERTLNSALKELKDAGLIDWEHKKSKRNAFSSNIYVFLVDGSYTQQQQEEENDKDNENEEAEIEIRALPTVEQENIAEKVIHIKEKKTKKKSKQKNKFCKEVQDVYDRYLALIDEINTYIEENYKKYRDVRLDMINHYYKKGDIDTILYLLKFDIDELTATVEYKRANNKPVAV